MGYGGCDAVCSSCGGGGGGCGGVPVGYFCGTEVGTKYDVGSTHSVSGGLVVVDAFGDVVATVRTLRKCGQRRCGGLIANDGGGVADDRDEHEWSLDVLQCIDGAGV